MTGLSDARLDALIADAAVDCYDDEEQLNRCRRELLDRTLIWDQRHLLPAPHECHVPLDLAG